MFDVPEPIDHLCDVGLGKYGDVPFKGFVIAFGQKQVSKGSSSRLMSPEVIPWLGDFLQGGL